MPGFVPALAVFAAVAGSPSAPAAPLAPTPVEVRVTDAPLADVLASLEAQSGFSVRVADSPDAGKRKVTLDTGGKVPFWDAVERVAAAARMHADAIPPGGSGWRAFVNDLPRDRLTTVLADAGTAVVTQLLMVGADGESDLRTRHGGAVVFRPGRPSAAAAACVRGAVRVRVVPPLPGLPTASPETIPVFLHVAVEPDRVWKATTGLTITRATAADGRELTVRSADADVVVRAVEVPGGMAAAVTARSDAIPNGATVFPLPAHAAVTLAAPTGPPVTRLRSLAGELRGVVWGPAEELATAGVGSPGRVARAAGGHGVGMEVLRRDATDDVPEGLIVVLTYHPGRVRPPGANPWSILETGVEAGAAADGLELRDRFDPKDPPAAARTLHGLTVTDAAGVPFDLTPVGNKCRVSAVEGKAVHTQVVELTLTPTAAGQKPPATVRFRGSHSAAVRVPFSLSDVPVAAGAGK